MTEKERTLKFFKEELGYIKNKFDTKDFFISLDNLIEWSTQRMYGVLMFVADKITIEEEKELQKALEEYKEEFKKLLNNLPSKKS